MGERVTSVGEPPGEETELSDLGVYGPEPPLAPQDQVRLQ